MALHPRKMVLIGASTGGPGVIERIISALPDGYAYPVCIVQHFPPELTRSFATRLQSCTPNRVVESYEGLCPENGMVIVARGGEHLTFVSGENGAVRIHQISPLEGIRDDFVPSVDTMFASGAEIFGSDVMAVLLTGIGDDGAEGMLRIAQRGGKTVCQDEASCAVFGMPRQAIERKAAHHILSPEAIVEAIIGFGK